MTSIVEVRHVSKSYGNKQALKDVSLSIPAGRIVGLIGKNGMGKTTLIKLINDMPYLFVKSSVALNFT